MKLLQFITSSLLLFLLLIISHTVYAAPQISSLKYSEDEIIVRLKPSVMKSELNPIAASVEGTPKKELLLKNTYVLRIPKGNVEKVLKMLSTNPQIATASPNYIAEKLAVTNDPSLDKEWALFQIKAASSSASAWDKTAGKPDIKVAVLDTGIEKTHPDLKDKVVIEKNFTSSPDSTDHDGHGTHVAGIIAGVGNNAVGVVGTAYNTTLVNAKVLNDNGVGNYSDIADGIIWATDNGAKVINLSLGGPVSTQILEDAVNYAYNKGAVIVSAAGNSGANAISYPANYSNVISVAATDTSDAKASWSNYSADIKVAAPGNAIYSTYTGESYAYASGTSMASAFVSGEAALIWSTDICSTNDCVIHRIENTSDTITNTGKYWKYGRINAFRALNEILPESTPSATQTPIPSPTQTPTTMPAVPPAPGVLLPPTETPKPKPTMSPNTITVSAIEMWQTIQMSGRTIYVRVTIGKYSDPEKIRGALVTIDLTTPKNKVYTGTSTTNSSGQAVFALRNMKDLGVYAVNITSVKKNSSPYYPTKTQEEFLSK